MRASSLGSNSFFWIVISAIVIIFSATLFITSNMKNAISLYKPFAMFGIALLIVFIVTYPNNISSRLSKSLTSLASFIDRRGAFQSNSLIELPKFVIIRVLFGCFIFERMAAIAIRMPTNDWSNLDIIVPVLAVLLFSALLIIGFLTQLTLVLLILWDWQIFERSLGISTLGNDIAAMLAILLIFANAGAHYSIDAWLRKKTGLFSKIIRTTYYAEGVPPNDVIQITKFMTISTYWLVCIFSLMMHLSEEAWMTGVAGPHLLTNAFIGKYSDAFIWMLEQGSIPIVLAKVSLWAMLPWYFLVMPGLFLGKSIRTYIIIWGILFFILSLFFLQLGWLGEFEFLFWAALFISPTMLGKRGDIKIAYDDRCNLCDRTVNFLKRIDIFGRIELKPVSQNIDWLKKNNIAVEDAMTDLFGVIDTKNRDIYSGYSLYETLSRKLVLLWIAYPVLLVGRLSRIGPAVYRFIAARRTDLFGVCQIPTKKPESAISKSSSPTEKILPQSLIIPVFAHWIIFSIIYVMMIPAPFVGYHGVPNALSIKSLKKPARYLSRAAHVYGLARINVFNRTDLRMAENWFTIEYKDENQNWKLVPIFNKEGKRMELHKSDRVYYGMTLKFRRSTIGKEGCHFNEWEADLRYLTQHQYETNNTPRSFLYTQYHQPLADDQSLFEGIYKLEQPKVICEINFEVQK